MSASFITIRSANQKCKFDEIRRTKAHFTNVASIFTASQRIVMELGFVTLQRNAGFETQGLIAGEVVESTPSVIPDGLQHVDKSSADSRESDSVVHSVVHLNAESIDLTRAEADLIKRFRKLGKTKRAKFLELLLSLGVLHVD